MPTQRSIAGLRSRARDRSFLAGLVPVLMLILGATAHARPAQSEPDGSGARPDQAAAAPEETRSLQADAWLREGNSFLEARQLDEAIEKLTSAHALFMELPADADGVLHGRATALALLGDAHALAERDDEALHFWFDALESFEALEPLHVNHAIVLRRMARLMLRHDRIPQAVKLLRTAVHVHVETGQLEAALEDAQLVLDICDGVEVDPEAARAQAEVIRNSGVVLSKLGRTDEAIERLVQAADLYSSLEGEEAEHGGALRDVGYLLQDQGRHAEALPWFLRAKAVVERLPEVDGQLIDLLERIGAVLLALNRPEDALARFRETLSIQELRQDEEGQAYSRSNTGLALLRLGRLAEARHELEQAVALSQAPVTKADRLYNLGLVLSQLREDLQAIDAFESALTLLAPEPGTERVRAQIMLDLAARIGGLGRQDEARELDLQAIELLAQIGDTGILGAQLRINLASIEAERGQADVALGLLDEALAIAEGVEGSEAEEIRSICISEQADALAAAGRIAEAIALYEGVLDGHRAGRQQESLEWKLGLHLVTAGRLHEAAQVILRRLCSRWAFVVLNLASMAPMKKLTFIQGELSGEQLIHTLAFETGEGPAARAGLEAALLTKALHSHASRAERDAWLDAGNPEADALWARQVELRRSIAGEAIAFGEDRASEQNIIEDLATELSGIEDELCAGAQAFTAAGRLQPVSTQELLDALDSNEVLLQYVVYDRVDLASLNTAETRRYGLYVASGRTRTVSAVDLGPASSIEAAVSDYRETLERQSNPVSFDPDENALAAKGLVVRDLIMAPGRAAIGEASRLYVAGDGILSQVCFEALPEKQVDDRWTYSIESRDIVSLTTGRSLIDFRRPDRHRSQNTLLVAADPDYDADFDARAVAMGTALGTDTAHTLGAPRLPLRAPDEDDSAGEEIPWEWIRLSRTAELASALLGLAERAGWESKRFLGAAASEEVVTSFRSPGCLVLATHGCYLTSGLSTHIAISIGPEHSSINPDLVYSIDPLMRSMLVLAGAGQRDDRRLVPRIGDGAGDASAPGQLDVEGLQKSRCISGDGLLTAFEVWGMDLRGTELVALIGCESGRGVVQGRGEGSSSGLAQARGEIVAGLPQAFFIAGARSVLMSLWKVPAAETTRQMTDFFERWMGGSQARYPAFRDSQLAALGHARSSRGSGHPLWWAGFVYVGDPGDVR